MSESLNELEKLLKSGWAYHPHQGAVQGTQDDAGGDTQTFILRYKDKMKETKIEQSEMQEAKKIFEQYQQPFPAN